jgi:cytochrome b6-f complex iron-sulfur subunit
MSASDHGATEGPTGAHGAQHPHAHSSRADHGDQSPDSSRRGFIQISTLAATAACVGSGALITSYAVRYLYPPDAKPAEPVFIAVVADIAPGSSRAWTTPTGANVLLTRVGTTGTADDFRALSNVCPHLGCKVHWEQSNSRFFCPCHNGTFSPDGKGTGGPPGDAGQSLSTYPLSVKDGGLYIMVAPERRF